MRDIMGMMGKVKEMQSKMEKVQEEIAALEVEGRAGGGLVTVILNGKGEMRGLKIRSFALQGRRGGNPRRPDRGCPQGRQGKGRSAGAGKDGRPDRRSAAAARHEIPVLI